MASSGSCTSSGYQGRTITFNWWQISQDIGANQTRIGWNLVGSGDASSSYYKAGNFKVLINGQQVFYSATRISLYNGTTIAGGEYVFGHDGNGNAAFSVHIEAGIYSTAVNCSGDAPFPLNIITRKATIVDTIGNFDDEGNPWIEFNNPGNLTLYVWLEPNPASDHYCGHQIGGTNGRYTWTLTEDERKQLRKACRGNSCVFRIGLYSHYINGNWAFNDYRDVTFTIKNPMPIAGTPTWRSTNLTTLADTATVIKGYSSVSVTVPAATPVKEATIKQYKVIIGDKIATKVTWGTFEIENVNDSIIKVYVEDSRGNTVEKILNITKFIDYYPPMFKSLSLERAKGGIGTNAVLKFSGSWWQSVFGKVSNSLNVQYFYKEQGSSSDWIQGTTNISGIFSGDDFDWSFEIAGDLGANGFNAGNNYDIKLIATDKLANAEKMTILTSGVPNMSIHRNGVAFGAFYDVSEGGPLQIDGKSIMDFLSFSYSLDEKETTDTWIDGRKIYIKTIAVNFGQATTTTSHGIINLDFVVNCIIGWCDTVDGAYYQAPREDGGSIYVRLQKVTASAIYISCSGTDWQPRTKDRYAILKYVKKV